MKPSGPHLNCAPRRSWEKSSELQGAPIKIMNSVTLTLEGIYHPFITNTPLMLMVKEHWYTFLKACCFLRDLRGREGTVTSLLFCSMIWKLSHLWLCSFIIMFSYFFDTSGSSWQIYLPFVLSFLFWLRRLAHRAIGWIQKFSYFLN